MLENVTLFSGLSKTDLETIVRHCVVRTYPAHAIILREGEASESLYVILEGKVKIFVSESSGDEAILNIQGAGECFGEMALLDAAPCSASVMAMEAARVAVMTKRGFKECLAQHPDIAFNLIRGLTQRVRVLSGNVRNLALHDVYTRVARTLRGLATDINGEFVIDQKLTHQEIANMVGATREMVSRVLKDLANDGCIRVERRRITLTDKLPIES
jgi:CRP/FNR family cyclic AMP-dependent transcriptional regulator